MSIYGVLFVLMSLMKSLSMVARTEVLHRNTPGDWSIKDRTSCTEEPPSWTRGWHRQNHASGRGKVHNHLRTHGSEGATKPGRNGPGPVGPAGRPSPHLALVQPPFPCTRRIFNPKTLEAPPFAEGEPFAQGGHPQAREREEGHLQRGIDHLEGSTHKWRRRKTPSEGWPWSTVLCLAPWWGNLLIRPWVVIDLEM
jgi:hypothetical protein